MDVICDTDADPLVRPITLLAEHVLVRHFHFPQKFVSFDSDVIRSASHLVLICSSAEVYHLLLICNQSVDVEVVVLEDFAFMLLLFLTFTADCLFACAM